MDDTPQIDSEKAALRFCLIGNEMLAEYSPIDIAHGLLLAHCTLAAAILARTGRIMPEQGGHYSRLFLEFMRSAAKTVYKDAVNSHKDN